MEGGGKEEKGKKGRGNNVPVFIQTPSEKGSNRKERKVKEREEKKKEAIIKYASIY